VNWTTTIANRGESLRSVTALFLMKIKVIKITQHTWKDIAVSSNMVDDGQTVLPYF